MLAGVSGSTRISQTPDVYPLVPGSSGVACGAVKCIWRVMCLWCCTVSSIQHFTAHKISAAVCSVTVLHVAVTSTELMKYTALRK